MRLLLLVSFALPACTTTHTPAPPSSVQAEVSPDTTEMGQRLAQEHFGTTDDVREVLSADGAFLLVVHAPKETALAPGPRLDYLIAERRSGRVTIVETGLVGRIAWVDAGRARVDFVPGTIRAQPELTDAPEPYAYFVDARTGTRIPVRVEGIQKQ